MFGYNPSSKILSYLPPSNWGCRVMKEMVGQCQLVPSFANSSANSLSTLFRSKSSIKTLAAPTKLVPQSLYIAELNPRRALNRRKAAKNPAVLSSLTISKCMARVHLKIWSLTVFLASKIQKRWRSAFSVRRNLCTAVHMMGVVNEQCGESIPLR